MFEGNVLRRRRRRNPKNVVSLFKEGAKPGLQATCENKQAVPSFSLDAQALCSEPREQQGDLTCLGAD